MSKEIRSHSEDLFFANNSYNSLPCFMIGVITLLYYYTLQLCYFCPKELKNKPLCVRSEFQGLKDFQIETSVSLEIISLLNRRCTTLQSEVLLFALQCNKSLAETSSTSKSCNAVLYVNKVRPSYFGPKDELGCPYLVHHSCCFKTPINMCNLHCVPHSTF